MFTASNTNCSKSLGLNFSYCLGKRVFVFIVPLNAFMTEQFTEAKSMGGVTGPYSVLRPALKIKNRHVGLQHRNKYIF